MDVLIIILIATLSLILFILLILLIVGKIAFNMSFKRRKKRNVLPTDLNIKLDKEWFLSVIKEEVSINAFDGVILKGYLIKSKQISNKYLVCCHGYGGKSIELSYFSHKMHDLGYNLLLVDHRACGESGGKFMSMGYYESKDLSYWVNFVHRINNDSIIALYGWSMGAATCMMSLRYLNENNIKAIIEDCGYDLISNQLCYVAKNKMNIVAPKIMLNCLDFYCKNFNGINVKDGPLNYLINTKVPILFIHGENDLFVPTKMAYQMFNVYNNKGQSQIKIFSGSQHVMSLSDHDEEYINLVDIFLREKMK